MIFYCFAFTFAKFFNLLYFALTSAINSVWLILVISAATFLTFSTFVSETGCFFDIFLLYQTKI